MAKQDHRPRNSELAPGIMKYSRSAMYKKRGMYKKKKAGKPTPYKPTARMVEKKIGGENNGSTRKVPIDRAPRFYPTEDFKRKAKKGLPFSKHVRKLRSSITPGTVLILLTGVHKRKRVVFLKQLSSGLLLVTGPYVVNGCPLRRVNQKRVIATSTKIDISGINVDEVTDNYFRSQKADKAGSDEILEGKKGPKFVVGEERKATQKKVDTPLLAKLGKDMQKYLKTEFWLQGNMLPHLMKF